jgi:alpha-glucosidase
MMKSSFLGCCIATACVVGVQAEEYTVKSPDGKTSVELSVTNHKITYALSWDESPILAPSETALFEPADYTVLGSVTIAVDETWKPVWGQFSEVRDQCNELTLKLETSGIREDLICRVYNEGIGLRFAVPEQQLPTGKKVTHYCAYNAVADVSGFFPRGEGMPLGPQSLSTWAAKKGAKKDSMSLPGVFELSAGKYMAVLDSDLYSAKPFTSSQLYIDKSNRTPFTKNSGVPDPQGFVTPWRVVLLGDNLGDLLVNTVPLNLAAPCEIADTSWIKPGKGLWDWRIHGYDNGEFQYGIDTRSYLRLIDFCAAQGIQYLTIDDNWFSSAKNGIMKIAPEVDMKTIMAYGKKKGVGIVLYYDRKKGDFGDDKLFTHYHELGAAGI